ATNRPPGRRARATFSTTRPASFIQCNAALLKTASNSPANVMSEALSSTTLIPRRRAATQNSRLESSPTTRQPTSAIFFVSTPSPQPRSRMLSPGCGASSSNTGAPRSVTKRPFLAYASAFQVCADISGIPCSLIVHSASGNGMNLEEGDRSGTRGPKRWSHDRRYRQGDPVAEPQYSRLHQRKRLEEDGACRRIV